MHLKLFPLIYAIFISTFVCGIFNKDYILKIKIFLFVFSNCNKVKMFVQALKRKLQEITEINYSLHN